MLKKTVMIPLKTDDQGRISEQPNINHPFMRGVMEFDDYNYTPFNEMVLLKEPEHLTKQETAHPADDKSVVLSIKTIDRWIDDEDYNHDEISLPLTAEQQEQKRIEKEKAEEIKTKKRKDEVKRKQEEQ